MVVNDLVLAKQFVLGKTRCTEDLSEDMNTGHFVVGLILNLGNAEFWVSEVQFKRQQGRWKKTRVWMFFSGLFVTGTAPWVDLGVRVGGLFNMKSRSTL